MNKIMLRLSTEPAPLFTASSLIFLAKNLESEPPCNNTMANPIQIFYLKYLSKSAAIVFSQFSSLFYLLLKHDGRSRLKLHSQSRETKKAEDKLLPFCLIWLRGQDLNLRPSGYEPDELPSCSTPRYSPVGLTPNVVI